MSGKCSSHMLILTMAFCVSPVKMVIGQTGPGMGYAKIPKGAYSVIAEVHAKPGKTEDLRAATLPLIHLVRGDPKNLVYFFQEDRENPGHFIFYEVFATKQDFEAHNNMPYVKEWFAKLPELAEGGVKTTRMQVQPAARKQ
jgi:quinol monooxygenase YgiN